ncbi:gamma-glutamyltransferase family protein [Asticcacaulis sp. EMRT-3]|uniref:gamma-glutamyltransferase family protein n=1 Tax=Asticcacaulis sp. EMRT-3 TaxID=3040349 RepID=UPI0024AFDAD9|nr:gamma-glutamyltransferase family protein [Asticcacaulis sp. EMRT-3]MDI7773869.1 gamma-glutamyltransferase family protein [Asticcacaulis sp. EMRT-3]
MIRLPLTRAPFKKLAAVSIAALTLISAGAQARVMLGPVRPLIVAAEPLAAQAGMDVLKRGGTAADAAVAVQAMLALIEPQSSSLSGGAFMLYYDAKTGELTDYNGREVAPAAAQPDMFMKDATTPMTFKEAVLSGRSTGVPGAIFMLDQAQKDHGKLAWNTLFGAAEAQAENGFVITPRIDRDLHTEDGAYPERDAPDVLAYFSDGKGGLLKTGDIKKNPDYADSLKAIAAQRSDALRYGRIAQDIVNKTHQAPIPGSMTTDDIANYKVIATTARPYVQTDDYHGKPLCVPYHQYIVCANNTPSGGPALLQGLRIAENLPLAKYGAHDPRGWAALIEVERLMYADRDRYEGDTPLFAKQINGYLNSNYTMSRAATVRVGTPSPTPQPGQLPFFAPRPGPDATIEPGGTTHYVIRDTWGNVVSMTTTVESLFGSGRMVDGFFLNNQLTDFSFTPRLPDGQPVANAVAGGKHPRSSMAPVIVFDQKGHVVAAVGSPGGLSIIAYDLKTLIGVLDWGLSMQQAIDLPNVIAKGDMIRVEKARMEPAVWDGLTRMGYHLTAVSGEESGLNGFFIRKDGSYDGGTDPHREGVVLKGK